ncbi:MAG TPA: hemolysin family protein [Gemmatimonadaceae bacterium]|nr:hemolysin family protein [Gemmatimonadaceae bacterium]
MIGILVLILLLVAWLTAAATSLRSASRLWLRDWVEQQLTGKVTAEAYVERLHQLLAASVSAAALLAILAGIAIGARPEADALSNLIAILAFGLAVLVLGQLVPRALARRWSSKLVPVLLPTLRATSALISPVQRLASAVAAASVRPAKSEQSRREGFEELLREGQLEGIGEREEIDIITGVVQFGERVLRDVMTPRTAVFAVDIALSPLEMAAVIASSGYSRVPVYRDSLDEIVGVVHVFDVFRDGGERMAPLRPVPHAPATKRVSEMLFEMLRGQFHFAVVVDEFGGTAGIATLEDLLEELVGDIHDEHDEPAISDVGHSRHAVVLDASMPASEVAARFDAVLPDWVEDRSQPLAGLIVRALGRIPVVGERFVLGSLELTVVRATATRIQRLLAQRADAGAPVSLKAPK